MARRRRPCLARLPEGPVGLSGQMHGLVVLDADDRVLRPGDPLERPAHRRRVRRDRGARRPRAADRADRQPRADRLHRAEAALAAPARARDVRADPPRAAAEGLRPLPPDRRARDRRRRRLGDAALRRRRPALVGGGLRRARDPARVAARRRTSRPRSPAPATRRPAALGVGIDRPGPRLGRARHVRRRLRRAARPTQPDPEARVHVFCHAVPGHVARDGRDAQRRRLARLAARRARRRPTASSTPRPRAGRPGPRGCCSRRTSPASARRTPTRTRAARSPGSRSATTAARSARAMLEGVAYGLRDSLELLRELGVRARGRPRLGRRRAQRALAADRRLGARPAARAHRVRGGLGLRRRAARRRARRRLRRRRRRGRALRPRPRPGRARPGVGRRPTTTATSASARSTRP